MAVGEKISSQFPRLVERSEQRPWLIACLSAFASVLAAGWLVVQPKPSGDLLVVFAPWASRQEAYRAASAAGAAIVGAGRWPSFLVVRTFDEPGKAALYGAGAWLLLDPGVLLACIASPEEP